MPFIQTSYVFGMHTNYVISSFFMLVSFAAICNALQSDIDCLRSIKQTFQDPENLLNSWDFNNSTEGFICRFVGIECWHPDESKVLNIHISDMGLRGPFPVGIKKCTSLNSLDLSSNHITGQIPSNIGDLMPFITTLDLSSNNLSGPIPPSLGDLSFINVLNLKYNQLTGQIPPELSKLDRIKEFSVANNSLSGQVLPVFRNASIGADSYAGNPGLCGGPLSRCKTFHDEEKHIILSGFAVGFLVSTTLTVLFILCCLPGSSNMRSCLLMMKKVRNGRKHHVFPRNTHILFTPDNKTEESKINGMEKHVRRLDLEELKMATNDFDTKNVIGYGNMGLMYKASFPNGLMLAVKRLHKFDNFEKEFLTEIQVLGRLRHTNLVPLLCFCFEFEKKFLVYKFMSNGTLHQWLHSRPQLEGKKMAWELRLRIAVGIARGLAWLHENSIIRVAHLRIDSDCILLDENFEPKISNFGNSLLLMNTIDTNSSDCTSMAPHSSPGPCMEDVYSFGCLLLELVSGKEWSHAETYSLGDNISGEEFDMIEECLLGQGFHEEIYEIVRIAKNCIQPCKDRTTSMLQVYQWIHTIGISRPRALFGWHMDLGYKSHLYLQ